MTHTHTWLSDQQQDQHSKHHRHHSSRSTRSKRNSNLKPWQPHGFDIAAHHWFPGSGTAIQLDTHRRNRHYINIRKNSMQLRACCMKNMHDITCILSWVFPSFPLIQTHQNKQSLLNREPNTPPGNHRIVPEELGQTAQGQGQVQVEASVGIFLGRGYCWCFVARYLEKIQNFGKIWCESAWCHGVTYVPTPQSFSTYNC